MLQLLISRQIKYYHHCCCDNQNIITAIIVTDKKILSLSCCICSDKRNNTISRNATIYTLQLQKYITPPITMTITLKYIIPFSNVIFITAYNSIIVTVYILNLFLFQFLWCIVSFLVLEKDVDQSVKRHTNRKSKTEKTTLKWKTYHTTLQA